MKKKIVLGIIFIIFLSSLSVAAIENIETKHNIKKQNIENKLSDRHFSYEHEVIENASENGDIGDFDLIADIVSWWSPFPWIEGKEARCCQVYVKREGCYQSEDIYWIHIRAYWIYSNGEEELMTSETFQYGGGIYFKSYIRHNMCTCTVEEKPVKTRVEVETLIPESNTENNEKTVNVGLGITINGYVYKKNIFGKKSPVDPSEAEVWCMAEKSHFLDYYFHYYTMDHLIFGEGHYFLSAPLKSGNPPYTYIIKAKYGIRTQRKSTEPLYEFENTTMEDFVFLKIRNKTVNTKLTNILARVINQHQQIFPILRQLLGL